MKIKVLKNEKGEEFYSVGWESHSNDRWNSVVVFTDLFSASKYLSLLNGGSLDAVSLKHLHEVLTGGHPKEKPEVCPECHQKCKSVRELLTSLGFNKLAGNHDMSECPECHQKSVVPSNGGGVRCITPKCGYWFCY